MIRGVTMEDISSTGKKINEVLQKTLSAIENGKNEIFDIAENLRKECEALRVQIKNVQNKIDQCIRDVTKLETQEKNGRKKLLVVSKNFNKYNEYDIRKAYEYANNMRIRLMLKQQEEKDLVKRRNDLEIRLKNVETTLKKAEGLMTQVGLALEYLGGDLDDIIETVEDMSKKQLLGIKIIEAQEEERQRVARDIHDGPAQSMANVVLKADLCEKLIHIDKDRVKGELNDLKKIVRKSLKDIRRIIYDLRPMSLDDLGLVPTVERYSEIFSEETYIDVRVNAIGEVKRIKSVIQIALFRIIQESLNNVRKHSNATQVKINMENTYNSFNLIVSDNGEGFDKKKIKCYDNPEKGLGIEGMKQRVELLNGKFDIQTALGKGTKIYINIPINERIDS